MDSRPRSAAGPAVQSFTGKDLTECRALHADVNAKNRLGCNSTEWRLVATGAVNRLHLMFTVKLTMYSRSLSRGRTNSGVLSVQRQPVDHAHRHRHILELTCDFNSSIYRCGNARRTNDVIMCVLFGRTASFLKKLLQFYDKQEPPMKGQRATDSFRASLRVANDCWPVLSALSVLIMYCDVKQSNAVVTPPTRRLSSFVA